MDKPNGKVSRVELEMVLDHIKETLPVMLQKAEHDAKLIKAKYEALLAEGFTEAQALKIVSTRELYE